MLHTDKQTDRQTNKQINAGKNIYLLQAWFTFIFDFYTNVTLFIKKLINKEDASIKNLLELSFIHSMNWLIPYFPDYYEITYVIWSPLLGTVFSHIDLLKLTATIILNGNDKTLIMIIIKIDKIDNNDKTSQ